MWWLDGWIDGWLLSCTTGYSMSQRMYVVSIPFLFQFIPIHVSEMEWSGMKRSVLCGTYCRWMDGWG